MIPVVVVFCLFAVICMVSFGFESLLVACGICFSRISCFDAMRIGFYGFRRPATTGCYVSRFLFVLVICYAMCMGFWWFYEAGHH